MDKQWVVLSHEEGLIGIFDNYDEALKEYHDSKDAYENYVHENGEHDPNEDIILATIDRRFYSYDTKEPTEDSDTTTYWDFKEDSLNIDPIPLPTIKPGDKVRHKEYPASKGIVEEVFISAQVNFDDARTDYRLIDLEVISDEKV